MTMQRVSSASRYDQWCRRTDGPLLWLAAVFLIVFVLPLYLGELPDELRSVLVAANIVIWMAFAVDYAARLWLSPERWTFVKQHLPDLMTLAIPVLRVLRLVRVIGVLSTAPRRAGQHTQLRTTSYIVGAVAVLLFVSAGLVLDAERNGANIKGVGDALWWSATTVTTVGYGDLYPATGTGRLVAVLLMLGGIALLGVITASVAAWFIGHFTSLEDLEEAVDAEASSSASAMADITARLERLERLLIDAAARASKP